MNISRTAARPAQRANEEGTESKGRVGHWTWRRTQSVEAGKVSDALHHANIVVVENQSLERRQGAQVCDAENVVVARIERWGGGWGGDGEGGPRAEREGRVSRGKQGAVAQAHDCRRTGRTLQLFQSVEALEGAQFVVSYADPRQLPQVTCGRREALVSEAGA